MRAILKLIMSLIGSQWRFLACSVPESWRQWRTVLSRRVLESLKLIDVWYGNTTDKGISIIQSRFDHSSDKKRFKSQMVSAEFVLDSQHHLFATEYSWFWWKIRSYAFNDKFWKRLEMLRVSDKMSKKRPSRATESLKSPTLLEISHSNTQQLLDTSLAQCDCNLSASSPVFSWHLKVNQRNSSGWNLYAKCSL